VDKRTPRARPERQLRFFIEGRPGTGEQFWQAVRDLGGQAVVTAHDPRPMASGYRLTELGRLAMRQRPSREQGQERGEAGR
jgi:hypothetical protein